MVDSISCSDKNVEEQRPDVIESVSQYGENLYVIPPTNQIRELQTIIRDK